MRWVAALFVIMGCAAGARSEAPRIRLIELGWDAPSQADMRRDLAAMETRPFDGVVLHVTVAGQPQGVPAQLLLQAHARGRWERRWFAGALTDLRAIRSAHPRRLVANFARVGANPGDVDWFDDAGWRDIVEHWRTAAWLARQGGLKGICFDPEPYAPPHSQFSYAAQPERARHTFTAYQAKARQRGREVMRAVAAEYPDITILALFLGALNVPAARQADPSVALREEGYGLYPAFVDGWLDEAPPGVTLVDGNESAYYYTTEAEFRDAALAIHRDVQALFSPGNRAKYRAQVQAGSALYLDAHLPKGHPSLPASFPFTLPGEGPRDRLLAQHAAWAVATVDEYVWVYGEQNDWWGRRTGQKGMPWPEALPRVEKALWSAAHPDEALRDALDAGLRSGTLQNLARDGDFAGAGGGANAPGADWKAEGAPPGWSFWHVEGSKGIAAWDRQVGGGAARMTGEGNGCFIQTYDASPGDRFVVRARARWTGEATPRIRVRWQSPDGKWVHEQRDVIAYAGGRGADGWATCSAAAVVPEGAGRLVVLLGVSGQAGAQESAWFDDVEVYRLP